MVTRWWEKKQRKQYRRHGNQDVYSQNIQTRLDTWRNAVLVIGTAAPQSHRTQIPCVHRPQVVDIINTIWLPFAVMVA